MVDQLHSLFGIQPHIDLNLMRPDQTLNDLSSRVFHALDRGLLAGLPDWVLVQGDTTTVMVSAIAAFHRGIRIAHIEAGLRTGDLAAPFPEEANRRITDLVSDILFAPTDLSRQNLINEGSDPTKIFVTGNTVVDVLQWISKSLPDDDPVREVLITVHRRENFGEPLRRIFCDQTTLTPIPGYLLGLSCSSKPECRRAGK